MPAIKIENFGGEMPSMSARALPANAAQENRNLFMGVSEFRPLKADTSVGTSVAGAKSLYRIDATQPWITATKERNYVRGQINGDTNKRTYYTVNDGTSPPMVMDVTGETRRLGVPAPDKPTLVHTATPQVTWEQASSFVLGEGANSIRRAIAENKMPAAASQHYQGITPLAGPAQSYGLLFPDNPLVPARLQEQPWCLIARVTEAVAAQWQLTPDLGLEASAGYVYFPVPCMPYKFQINETTLRTALATLPGPDGATAMLNENMIDTIINAANTILDPDVYAPRERRELDAAVWGLADTVTNGAPTMPTRPTQPVKPTSPEWVSTGSSESDAWVRNPEWVDYDADVAQYSADLEAYTQAVAKVNAAIAGVNGRLKALQDQSVALMRAIENEGKRRWESISLEGSELASLVQTLGGVSALAPYAVDRTVETRFYVVTFVAKWSGSEDESAPSTVSDVVELDQNDLVTVNRPTLAGGTDYAGRKVTHWRVYRSNVGSTGAAFQYVDEAPIGASTMADTKLSSQLGEVLPTTTWAEPPADLRGLVGLPNGIMAGFTNNVVAFCEPYVPYAWPVDYQVTTELPIVAMAAFGQTLFVATTGNPYFISGADSASMSAVKAESNQSCVAPRSMVSVQGGVLYASPDGLCLASQAGVQVVSQGLYTREDWQALTPSSMFAVEHEGIYYLFYNNGTKGCLAFDLVTKKLGRVQLQADAAFTEMVTDTLFVAADTQILAVFVAATRRTGLWKSARMVMPAQVGLGWLKVYGDQSVVAPVTVKWYGDGVLRHTATVTSTAPQRLPGGRWLEHEIEIESAARVTRVVLAGDTQELQQV